MYVIETDKLNLSLFKNGSVFKISGEINYKDFFFFFKIYGVEVLSDIEAHTTSF